MLKLIFYIIYFLPGEPAIIVNGGTTVSGGKTVLSAIAQQSFSTHLLPLETKHKILIHKLYLLQTLFEINFKRSL